MALSTLYTEMALALRELSIRNLLNRVDELPEVPHIALKAIHLLSNPDTAVSNLAEVISSDQALTAKVLRLCNSAYYGLPRQVTTISEAVMIVGFSTIKSLVLMITTQSTLNKGLLGYKMSAGEFWEHSIATATISRLLAHRIHYHEPEECFIAGLLHDIGKLVLNQSALPEVYKATNLYQKKNMPIYLAEQKILGFDHAEIGAALAERWNFPPLLVDSIRWHHDFSHYEQQTQDNTLPILVATANLLTHWFRQPGTARTIFHRHATLIGTVLKLRADELDTLLPQFKKKIEETCQMALLVS